MALFLRHRTRFFAFTQVRQERPVADLIVFSGVYSCPLTHLVMRAQPLREFSPFVTGSKCAGLKHRR